MRLLQRNAKVTTRYGGGFVQSIDGLGGRRARRAPGRLVLLRQRRRVARRARPPSKLHAGDRVWWDHHDWGGDADDPGRRRLVPRAVRPRPRTASACPSASSAQDPRGPACTVVSRAAGARSACPPPAAASARRAWRRRCALVVGPLGALGDDPSLVGARAAARRPAASTRAPRRDGRSLTLLDARGPRRVARSAPATGLIAATRPAEADEPVWVVTGTDAAGVATRRAGVRRARRCATASPSP